ncbi:MAG: RnfH family protein [Gemmatimonadota bacterium]
MESDRALIHVGVVRAWPDRAERVDVTLAAGSTLRDALLASGLLSAEELADPALAVGVFSQIRPVGAALRDGDRVEIYRPLLIEPKEARRARAAVRKSRRPD